MKQEYKRFGNLFCQLLLLTAIFLLIEVSFFVQSIHFYIGDFYFIAHKIKIPSAVFLESYFLFLHNWLYTSALYASFGFHPLPWVIF